MTKDQTPSKDNRYLITPSLLNSWLRIFDTPSCIRETEEECLEDKIQDYQEKATLEYLDTLKRVQTPTNKYMQAGIEFEEECYKGNTCVSPIIKNGAYQIVGIKKVTILGINLVMYGRLDVLKGGIIYDIKRVRAGGYKIQKYLHSAQHPFYLELFSRSYQFTYLAYDGKDTDLKDLKSLHKETYYKDTCESIYTIIENFINRNKEHGYLNIYLENWKSKY